MKKRHLLWSFLVVAWALVALFPLAVSAEETPIGWVYDGDDYYYYAEDGTLIKDQVIQIDGNYYGFNHDGIMYTNLRFSMYDAQDGWVYYCAKADGSLYVNSWYDDFYYYGEEGKAAHGLCTVNGTQYYFSFNGYLWTDDLVQIEETGTVYALGEDGTAVQLSLGWNYCFGNTYYLGEDGAYSGTIKEIDGAYYGFDTRGKMFVDTEFSLYDDTQRCNVYYRAKADGSLYVNSWYDDFYYYGEEGKAVHGLCTVNGTQYYFAFNGYLWTDDLVQIEETGTVYALGEDGTAVQLSLGWNYCFGNAYYLGEDGAYSGTVEEIDGAYYGFDNKGKMFVNTAFDLCNDALGRWAYYRAKDDGSLYVNEWYEDEYGSFYYYGETGKALDGLHTVNGTLYYFISDGYLCRDGLVQIEETGTLYALGEDGVAIQLSLGWNYCFGNYYYMSEDGVYTSTVKEINGMYYGFDYNGKMFVNTAFDLYDDALGRWVYYRAKNDGSLYVNEWYEDEYGSFCYYGETGKPLDGLHTVNGTQYYFSNGYMCVDQLLQIESTGNAYAINVDGVAVQLSLGWNYCFGNYYYMSEGGAYSYCVVEIDGKYYGFNYYGEMYANTSFSFYDSAQSKLVYYRAKVDGSLYVNEWYEDKYGSFYYYGETGKALDGLHTVNGTQYYFSNGYMCVDQLVQIESTGNAYAINEDGVAVQLSLGWNYCFGNYYYMSEDGPYSYCVVEIDGKYYGFDWDGKMFSDGVYGLFDITRDDWVEYRANLDGSLYVNEWYLDRNLSYYYYGEMGKSAYGLTQIGDAQYFFESGGYLCKNGIYSANGVTCYCDNSGIATVVNNGWNLINKNYYYVDEGTYYSDCIAQIGDAYYAFDNSGILYSGKEFYEYRIASPDGKRISGYFCARTDGSLLVNEWVCSESGWKYYGENGCRADGLRLINGNYYYFIDGVAVENQNMIVGSECYSFATGGYGHKVEPNTWVLLDEGTWAYVQDDGTVFSEGILEINGVKYLFSYKTLAMDAAICISSDVYYLSDSEGRVITQEGWHTCYGDYYYVENDASLALGWKEIGGHRYYLTPAMKHDALFRNDEKIYIADTAGHVQQVTGDGLYSFAHEYDSGVSEIYASYYIENGELLKEQWKYYDGAWYYLNSNGKATTGPYVIDDIRYYFDENGIMQTDTWIMRYSTTYYVDASGRVAIGLQTIDGVQYIFADWGGLVTGCIYNLDGASYAIREDGTLVGQATTENGWNLINGTWYYAIDGKLLTDKTVVDNGKTYGFDQSGRMLVNECEHGYYFGADGAAQTGWISYGSNYMYATDDGTLMYNGIVTIDGQQYLFQWHYMQTGLVIYNDQLVDCGDDGVIRSVSGIPEGYSYVDGDVYYYPNGEAYTGWVGNRYFQDGTMLRNTTVSLDGNLYLLQADGELLTNGFYEIAYILCCYAEDGVLVRDDWRFIDGYWYYFTTYGAMIRDQLGEIDGIYYCFDSDGHYTGRYQERELEAEGVADGWHYIDGNYYYAYAGRYVSDRMMYIDGSQYAFDQNGKMLTNEWRLDFTRFGEYAVVYFGADGRRLDATGWTLVDGQWVYFRTDHTVREGWFVADGKRYIQELEYISDAYGFNACPKGLVTGYCLDGDLLHYFNQSGELEYTVTLENGWYQAEDGAWYYFKNGKSVYGYTLIDGVEYYFDYDKVMATDSVCNTENGWRYASASGVLVTQQGWINTEKGWVYIQKNGKVAYAGVYVIDGVMYGFEDGYMCS